MPLYRSEVKDRLNLEVVAGGEKAGTGLKRSTTEKSKRWKVLDRYDQYYQSKQYDKLRPWSDQRDETTQAYIPIRKRKPSVIYSLPRLLVERAASKLVGGRQFPQAVVPVIGGEVTNDELTEQLLALIIKQSKMKVKAVDYAKEFFKSGGVFVSYAVINGVFTLKHYNVKHCSPKFNKLTNELEGVRVQYKYHDEQDIDKNGKPKEKWFRLDIDSQVEVLYDNPEVKATDNGDPHFDVVARVQHGMGFVPGQWIVNGESNDTIDGKSILPAILDIADAINYQLSQHDQALTYTLEPQLVFSGMDEHEIDRLVKSATKAWNLGREGQANFLEINGSGLEMSEQFRGNISQKAQDLAKVVILNPEKLEGVYQSGKAMEVLHAPLVDLIHEVRPWFGEYGLVPLLTKMLVTAINLNMRGEELSITFPEGYEPQSMDIDFEWKPIFEPTLQDIQTTVGIATQASTSNIISRRTATKFVAEYFGIKDIELEQKEVIEQPLPPSPFGPFGF